MAENKFISELPKATELKKEAQFVIEQDGLNKSVSGEQIKEFVSSVNKDNYTNMAQVTLPANIVGDKNVLTQNMVSSTNTIYKVEKDFEITADIVLGENSSLSFQGGSIKGEYDIKLNNGYIHNADLSLDSTLSGTLKNTTLESKWFITKEKFLDSINGVSNISNYEFENTQYFLDKNITFPQCTRNVNGNGATINITDQGMRLELIGADDIKTEIGAITVEAASLTNILVIPDTSSVKKGDLLIVSSLLPTSMNNSGNNCEVVYVNEVLSDTEVLLFAPLYLDYEIGAKVFKTERGRVNVSNLNIYYVGSEKNSGYGLILRRMQQSIISNVKVIGFRYCVALFYSNRISVLDTICDVVYNDTVNYDVYGLYIGNSQDVVVDRGEFTGGNHAITAGAIMGEGLPVALGLYYQNLKATNLRQGFAGLDAHYDACDYMYVLNCITSGVFFGATRGFVRDCILFKTNTGNGRLVLTTGGEAKDITIDNVQNLYLSTPNGLKGNSDYNMIKVANCGITEGMVVNSASSAPNSLNFLFENCVIDCGVTATLRSLNKLEIYKCTIDILYIADTNILIFDNNNITSAIFDGIASYPDKKNKLSIVKNNTFTERGIWVTQTSTGNLHFIDNILSGNRGGLTVGATHTIDTLVYRNNIDYTYKSATIGKVEGTINVLYIDEYAIQEGLLFNSNSTIVSKKPLKNPITLEPLV